MFDLSLVSCFLYAQSSMKRCKFKTNAVFLPTVAHCGQFTVILFAFYSSLCIPGRLQLLLPYAVFTWRNKIIGRPINRLIDLSATIESIKIGVETFANSIKPN